MPAVTQLRAVLDTNVYLSGLLFGGKPSDLISRGLTGEFVIVSSLPILTELREKLENRFGWRPSKVKDLFDSIIPAMEIVRVLGTLRAIPSDLDDNPILETAIVGGARYVVSGDKHILGLKEYENVQTITVDKFLTILSSA